jgi:hypothetical protein
MMAAVNPRWRAAFSTALVGLLGVVAAGAAWLGVAQEPSNGAVLWGAFVADTTATGSLAFITTSGAPATRDVTRGLVDFAMQEEIARTVLGNLRAGPEIELKVVHGVGYQRSVLPGAHGLGGWRRLSAPVGLAPFIGAALPLFSAAPADLTRLGEIDLRGTATTEYRVASSTFMCPTNRDGEPTYETSVVRAWVDGDGRIRQLQTVVFARFDPGLTFRSNTTTVLRRTGTPVHVNAPARFTQLVSPVNLRLTPGSDCVVTEH